MTTENVDLISRAAYFCDIGEMFIPDKMSQIMAGYTDTQDIQHTHTILGANLIRLNRSKNCSYFVELCAGMCLHHHERFDGQGYPYHIMGYNNSIYNQMCRLCDEFDNMRSKFYGSNVKPRVIMWKRLCSLKSRNLLVNRLIKMIFCGVGVPVWALFLPLIWIKRNWRKH